MKPFVSLQHQLATQRIKDESDGVGTYHIYKVKQWKLFCEMYITDINKK